jgi:hypothetical protein
MLLMSPFRDASGPDRATVEAHDPVKFLFYSLLRFMTIIDRPGPSLAQWQRGFAERPRIGTDLS